MGLVNVAFPFIPFSYFSFHSFFLFFLSFLFPIFPFDTDLTFFFHKKTISRKQQKTNGNFSPVRCFRQSYCFFVCFLGVPQSHLFPKIILIIYQPYSPLSMANQAFAHFGLEIIRRSSITRPLEGPYSVMILRTLIT